MPTESAFFLSCALVITALIITMGFGHCDQDSESFKRFKICMEQSKDTKLCNEANK